MEFVKFCKIEEFEKKTKGYLTKSIFGKKIAVFKDKDNSYFATEVSCKHQNSDLTLGKRDGDFFTCFRHGWKYNIKSGECVNQESPLLKKFETKTEDGYIKISIAPILS